jgi:hypothetical protein
MGRAFGNLVPISLEGRITGEKRIDEHDLVGEIESKSGMAEPSDLHGKPSFGGFKMGQV